MNTIYTTTLYARTLQYAYSLYNNKVNSNLYTETTLITFQNEAKPRFVILIEPTENHEFQLRITIV